MIELDFLKELSIVEIATIISAIGTSLAAFAALITTWLSKDSIKKADEERHMMVKPYLETSAYFLKDNEKKLEITLSNRGFNVFYPISAEWAGIEYIPIEIKRTMYDNEHVYKLVLDFVEAKTPTTGDIIFKYSTVLNKVYEERIDDVKINEKFHTNEHILKINKFLK